MHAMNQTDQTTHRQAKATMYRTILSIILNYFFIFPEDDEEMPPPPAVKVLE